MENTTGTKNSVANVAKSKPPMTARPSGAFCSPPSPRPMAIGTMPMIMASAVMTTGRMRTKPASRAASRAFLPSFELLARERHHQDAVRGGHADAHDRAGEGRNAQGGARDQQHPADAGERAGQRGDDDEGIEPRLEVDDDQKIDEHDRADEADGQPCEGGLHRLHLAADHDVAAPGKLWFDVLHDLLGDFVGDAAEVAAVDRGVDVDHALHVVVIDDGGARRGRGGRQVAEDLRRNVPGPVADVIGVFSSAW